MPWANTPQPCGLEGPREPGLIEPTPAKRTLARTHRWVAFLPSVLPARWAEGSASSERSAREAVELPRSETHRQVARAPDQHGLALDNNSQPSGGQNPAPGFVERDRSGLSTEIAGDAMVHENVEPRSFAQPAEDGNEGLLLLPESDLPVRQTRFQGTRELLKRIGPHQQEVGGSESLMPQLDRLAIGRIEARRRLGNAPRQPTRVLGQRRPVRQQTWLIDGGEKEGEQQRKNHPGHSSR